MPGYPRNFLGMLWTVVAAVLVTGLVLVPGALELRLEWDVPVHLPEGTRVLAAGSHFLAALLAMLVIGALIPVHMRIGLRRRGNRVTGIALATLFAALALSSIGIFYFGGEDSSRWASMTHLVLGFAIVIPLAIHAVQGARSSN